jgi:chromate reductase, NAD(P)H dehydrogenase (quinone)
MKIIAFAASTSRQSINKQLVEHTLTHFPEADCTLLDLNDFEMPVFSVDKEKENGYPEEAHKFLQYLESADLLIVSMTEHNGAYTAAFKNTFDWCSRIEPNTFYHKPMFLMSTSPGGYGGKNSLGAAVIRFPKHSAKILETFSLPSFYENFGKEAGIINGDLKKEHLEKIASVKQKMASGDYLTLEK